MKRSLVSTVSSAAMLAGVLVLCSQDDTVFDIDDAEEFTGVVSGQIVNGDSVGLSGALVTARPGGQTTVSGPGGTFTLSGLPPGRHVLCVSLLDYRDTLTDTVTLGLSDSLSLRHGVRMTYRFAWIRGTVTVPNQQILPLDAGLQVENQDAMARTLPTGQFFLRRVEPGLVRVYAAISGVGYGVREETIEAEDTVQMDIAIDRAGGTVSGTVQDSSGSPVANAAVSAVSGILQAATDSTGRFTLTEVPSQCDICLMVTTASTTMMFAGVSVEEGGALDLRSMTLRQNLEYNGITMSPSVAYASTADTTVMLVVSVSLADSLVRIASYDWDLDDDGTWDVVTPTSRTAIPTPGPGTHRVRVRCTTVDSVVSPVIAIEVVVRAVNRAPRLVDSSFTDTGRVGVEYRDTIHAVDDDGDSVRWFLVDTLPAGVVLQDSIVRWTPAAPCACTLHVAIGDDSGAGRVVSWPVAVDSALVPPQVNVPFPDVVARDGDTVTLFVTATGSAPLGYVWYHDGVAVDSGDSTYFVAALQPSDTGWYVVEVSNGAGSVVSDTLRLTIGFMGVGPWVPGGAVSRWRAMALIEAGGTDFVMGDTIEPDATPWLAQFTRDFLIDTVEVPQWLYGRLLGTNPSSMQHDTALPVFGMTWYDAVLFCNARSKADNLDTVYVYTSIAGFPGSGCTDLTGLALQHDRNGYRLPTEAEWEYASRGGTAERYSWGPSDTASDYAWFGGGVAEVVGRKQPNPYDLRDMAGNVAEWCHDWYAPYAGTSPPDPFGGPNSGMGVVVRGGSMLDPLDSMACGARSHQLPGTAHDEIGFRCVRYPDSGGIGAYISVSLPETTFVGHGYKLALHVEAGGQPPIRYEWRQLDSTVSDSASYLVDSATAVHMGQYSVSVWNAVDTVHDSTYVIVDAPVNPYFVQMPELVTVDGPMALVYASGTSFRMGQWGVQDAAPDFKVDFGYSFYIDTTEVTQLLYETYMEGENPSAIRGQQLPVYRVTWYDAVRFCNKRTQQEGTTQDDTAYVYTAELMYQDSASPFIGQCSLLVNLQWVDTSKGYRLPTEAEWEYACRGATTASYFWGEDSTTGWVPYAVNNASGPDSLGPRQPNPYRLYDICGNAAEWVWDWHAPYSPQAKADPTGPPTGQHRVMRGGDWDSGTSTMKSAARAMALPDLSDNPAALVGIRCVRRAP